jgi:hypothetical protein
MNSAGENEGNAMLEEAASRKLNAVNSDTSRDSRGTMSRGGDRTRHASTTRAI